MSAWLKIRNPLTPWAVVDRTDYLSEVSLPSFTLQRGSRGTASISLHVTAADSYVPVTGCQIFLYEVTGSGSKCVFAGSIDAITLTYDSDFGDRNYQLACVGFEQCFDTLQISPRTYATGTPCGTVFADILSTTCAGVPVAAGTIDAGANLAGPLVLDLDRPSDVFGQLAQDSGFIWWIDPDALTINFSAPTSPTAPFTLAASDILWGTIEWDQTRADFRNCQVVRSAFEANPPSADYFTGDGVTTAFTLRYSIVQGVRAVLTQSLPAEAIGTMTTQPTAGDTVSIQGDAGFFVASLDNTSSQGQVLIGATYQQTIQNLVDAINAEPSAAGIGYNLPTREQGATNADQPTGAGPYQFILRAKFAGAAYNSLALAATGTAFSWAAATLTGGVGTGGNDIGVNIVLDRADSVPADASDCTGSVGSPDIVMAVAPPADRALSISYYRPGSDCVTVEDTALVAVRAALEGGTGKYKQEISDTQQMDGGAALLQAQSALTFYKTLPVTFKFETDVAGLIPGQVLTIAITGAPIGSDTLIDGNWVVQEVQGDMVPGVEFLRSTGGHFRYTVSVINAPVVGTDIQFLQQLAGGSGGGGSSSGGGGGGTGGGSVIVASGGFHTITPSGGNADVDLAAGLTQRLVLNGTAVAFLAPTFTGGTISAGMKAWLYLDMDATGGRAGPTFTGGTNGFVSNFADLITIDGTASTRTAIQIGFDGSYWLPESQITKVATS